MSWQEDQALQNEEDNPELPENRKENWEYEYQDPEIDEEIEEGGNVEKYPNIHVKLVGTDGNVYSIIGRVRRCMARAGLPQSEIDAFNAEATKGDYNNVLATAMRWVVVH